MTLRFSFVPAPAPDQTPAQRAREVFVTATIAPATGNVVLPNHNAEALVTTVSRLNQREREAVKVHGNAQELARVGLVALNTPGVSYSANSGLSFAREADLPRFFARALPVETPSAEPEAASERPAELDEALEHLKRAGKALQPLIIRGSKELLGEVKHLFR